MGCAGAECDGSVSGSVPAIVTEDGAPPREQDTAGQLRRLREDARCGFAQGL